MIMTHTSIIIDSDTHFLVDAATRQIRNTATSKISVMHNDHNSERLTFSIPRFIEGHDMSTSDKIEIHYMNVDVATKEQTTGIYEPDDVKVETSGDSEVVTFSWLLSRNATKNVGSLIFAVRFACFTDDVVDYDWHTAPFSGLSVGGTLTCSSAIEEEYLDIIAAWEREHIEPLKKAVDELKNNSGAEITVDSDLSKTSENPVQNKVITTALEQKVDKEKNKTLLEYIPIKDDYCVQWERLNDDVHLPMGVSAAFASSQGNGVLEELSDVVLVLRSYTDDEHITVITADGGIYHTQYVVNYEDDEKTGWTEWEKVSVSQTDFDNAIGDIETSLENIITKYGLGGDDV